MRPKVVVFGNIGDLVPELLAAGFEVTTDPAEARAAVSTPGLAPWAPEDIPLVVVGEESAADLAVKRRRPGAVVVGRGEVCGALSRLLGNS